MPNRPQFKSQVRTVKHQVHEDKPPRFSSWRFRYVMPVVGVLFIVISYFVDPRMWRGVAFHGISAPYYFIAYLILSPFWGYWLDRRGANMQMHLAIIFCGSLFGIIPLLLLIDPSWRGEGSEMVTALAPMFLGISAYLAAVLSTCIALYHMVLDHFAQAEAEIQRDEPAQVGDGVTDDRR